MLKLQADRLRSSERFMRTLTNNIPGMIGYWNADLTCLISNAGYQEYFGKTPEQMAGLSIHELMGEVLFAKNEPMIKAALRGEPQQFERALIKTHGSLAFTWAQYVPDVYDGRVHGFFVLVSDLTDIKRAPLALAESEQFARTTIDTVPEMISVLDKAGVIITVSFSLA
jgi:PAS domain S-box-containing protein